MQLVRIATTTAALAVLWAQAAAAEPGLTTNSVNLRQGPGTTYPVVVTIPAGSRVEIAGCQGTWCSVTWRGQTGFTVATSLDQGGPPGGMPPPPPGGMPPPPPGGMPPPPPGALPPPPGAPPAAVGDAPIPASPPGAPPPGAQAYYPPPPPGYYYPPPPYPYYYGYGRRYYYGYYGPYGGPYWRRHW